MNYAEILYEAEKLLRDGGIEEARQDAWLLFEEAFSMSRSRYFLDQKEEAPGEKAEVFREMLEKRLARIPVQQIIGFCNFCGYDFEVNEAVLTPRHDTEVLVEMAYKQMLAEVSLRKVLKKDTDKAYRILDMCTGSGCIGMSMYLIAKEHGIDAEVTCVDLSDAALEVAKRNNKRLCDGRVKLVKSDLYKELEKEADKVSDREEILYDMILSNPPYIRSDIIESLSPEVKDHEPLMALDGSADGLVFYRRLSLESGRFLREQGRIYLEIGYDQGDEVKALFSKNGFVHAKVDKDLAGLDRVVSAIYLPGEAH